MSPYAISTTQAAKLCGVHYTTIRRWVLEGSLPAFETPGGHLRITRNDLDAFLRSRRLAGRKMAGLLKVLLVDDDTVFRDSALEYLSRQEGIEARGAGDGFSAGRLVAEFQPDVVVLDLLMPGMDGFAVCRDIKTSPRSRKTIVIVLTGFPTDENIRHVRECGADMCLAKPMDLEELVARIRQCQNSTVGPTIASNS